MIPSRVRAGPRARVLRAALVPGIFLVSVLIQWWVVATDRIPTNSDQAIVGLMAKHILEGRGHPVFYYGSTYAGSLEPHYVSVAFALFGDSPQTYRIAMAVLVLATMFGVFFVTLRVFGRTASLYALIYLSIPPFFFLYKGLTSDGHYNSFNLVTISAVGFALAIDRAFKEGRNPSVLFFALGLVLGVGWWVNPITPAIALASLLWLFARRRPRPTPHALTILLGGAVVGSFPWWFWNLRHGWASLKAPELGVVGIWQAARNLFRLASVSLPTLAGGMAPTPNPEFSREIFPFSRLLCLALLLLLLFPSVRRVIRGDRDRMLFFFVGALLFFAAALSARLVYSEPRFLFPYYAVVPPLLGAGLAGALSSRRHRALFLAAAAALLLLNAASLRAARPNLRIADNEVTGSLDPLSGALERAGIRRVYTDYWTAYRLSFESGERVIATPIPSDQFVRYAPHADLVNASSDAALVLLDPRRGCFRRFLEEKGYAFRGLEVGGFEIFSALPQAALDPIRAGKGLPLPREAYRVSWKINERPERLAAGASLKIPIAVGNEGPCIWPPTVHVSYHWWPKQPGLPSIFDGERAHLPGGALYPGASASVTVDLKAPPFPGRYRLEYDLVHEGVDWFSTKGGETVSVEMEILPR